MPLGDYLARVYGRTTHLRSETAIYRLRCRSPGGATSSRSCSWRVAWCRTSMVPAPTPRWRSPGNDPGRTGGLLVADQAAVRGRGGAFNVNGAHPFEYPHPLSNVLETVTMLLFPVALVRLFGRMMGSHRQRWALLAAGGCAVRSERGGDDDGSTRGGQLRRDSGRCPRGHRVTVRGGRERTIRSRGAGEPTTPATAASPASVAGLLMATHHDARRGQSRRRREWTVRTAHLTEAGDT
jgi:hypothetical protein